MHSGQLHKKEERDTSKRDILFAATPGCAEEGQEVTAVANYGIVADEENKETRRKFVCALGVSKNIGGSKGQALHITAACLLSLAAIISLNGLGTVYQERSRVQILVTVILSLGANAGVLLTYQTLKAMAGERERAWVVALLAALSVSLFGVGLDFTLNRTLAVCSGNVEEELSGSGGGGRTGDEEGGNDLPCGQDAIASALTLTSSVLMAVIVLLSFEKRERETIEKPIDLPDGADVNARSLAVPVGLTIAVSG